MGLFGFLLAVAPKNPLPGLVKTIAGQVVTGIISYGMNKMDGSHDHRYDKGEDRTPAQKAGDEVRKKR